MSARRDGGQPQPIRLLVPMLKTFVDVCPDEVRNAVSPGTRC